MKIQTYDILNLIKSKKYVGQRQLSEDSGYSLGMVNKCVRELLDNGFIDDKMNETIKTTKLFKENSPKRAIILAAGFGMRMIPINAQTPKGLIEIKGEPLIERIIKQLHKVGIKEIYVVVGFMKEKFEYLIDKYGVKLVVNSNYSSKNNLHSLKLVKNHLSNAYIIPCDIWCQPNPFNKYETHSWYMVSDFMCNDGSVRVNRKMELVVVPDDSYGNKMIGICYLTEKDANIVAKKINEMCKSSKYDDSFWEETLYHKERMFIAARLVKQEDVIEINTYEQLREADSDSNQLKTNAIQVVCDVLDVEENEITNIMVLKKGMTNRSFLFTCNGNKYIMRIPGEGTDKLIDRNSEAMIYQTISGYSFCDEPIYINPNNGYKITKYIENVRCCDSRNENDVRACMKKLRRFHSVLLKVSNVFDLFERIDFYESLWDGQPSIYGDYEKTKKNCISLNKYIEKHRGEMQLTHIDAVPDNFLFDPTQKGEMHIQLTDWEYAGMQDKHVDIAMFCIYSMYTKEEIDNLIDIYFEDDGGCDKTTRAKIYCYISVCGLIWSNWCEYKRNIGVEFGEYSLYQYRYSKEYYSYAVELINELGETI